MVKWLLNYIGYRLKSEIVRLEYHEDTLEHVGIHTFLFLDNNTLLDLHDALLYFLDIAENVIIIQMNLNITLELLHYFNIIKLN